ncbi:MAG: RNA polymerase subunit sigma-70 [Planctomycetaceae bacterium]|nr:RNA polymerase subunit sigma-70 [Planctomycetaceae bacterium]
MNSSASLNESTNPGSTDNGLLEGMRACDDNAWARFVDEYSPLIYVWCRNSDLQPADSLDVSQQVFQAVSRSITSFSKRDSEGSFRGWLFVITRNLIRNYLTRTLRGPHPQGGTSIQLRLLQEPELVDEESLSGEVSSARNSVVQSILDAAREKFDERTWRCFWLVAIEGQSAVEVAEQLGMKPDAVRQAKYRVTQRLRRDLGDFS